MQLTYSFSNERQEKVIRVILKELYGITTLQDLENKKQFYGVRNLNEKHKQQSEAVLQEVRV